MHRRSLSPIFTPDSPFMKKPINKGEASTSAVRVNAYETGSEPLCAMRYEKSLWRNASFCTRKENLRHQRPRLS